jgi:phosphoglycolate phosphatase-like HAD superfamily hydrolase
MGMAGPVGFDLDLTLIDSRKAILTAWSAVAEELGAHIDLAAVEARMGIKLEDEAAYWFPPDRLADATASYRRHYVGLAPSLTSLLPGACEALTAVRRAGERVVIITAKHPVSVAPSVKAVGLDAVADEIVTDVYGPEKAAVLVRIGAAAYVGDTPADVAAALAAGVVPVGVLTGSFSAADLERAGAQVILSSLGEFPDWYQTSRETGGEVDGAL